MRWVILLLHHRRWAAEVETVHSVGGENTRARTHNLTSSLALLPMQTCRFLVRPSLSIPWTTFLSFFFSTHQTETQFHTHPIPGCELIRSETTTRGCWVGGIEYHCCLVWWKSKSVPCGDTEMLVRRLTECARSCLVLQSVTTPGRTQVGGCNQTERAAVFFLCFVLFETVGAFFFFFTTLFQFHFKWTSYSVWIA